MGPSFDSWTIAIVLASAALYACSLAAAGGAIFRLCFPVLPPDLLRGCSRMAAGLAAAALLLTGLRLSLQAGFLAGTGPAGMAEPDLLLFVVDGPAGLSAGLRSAGLLLLIAMLLPGPLGAAGGAAGAVLTCLSFAFIGHSTGEPRLLLAALLLLHLLAVSFWLGALLPLLRVAATLPTAAAGAAMIRFGRFAGWAVGGLLAAGLALGVLLVGSVTALLTSGYGQLLLLKLVLVAALLALAALNRLRLSPALARGEAAAGRHLRRSIAAEILLAAAVLLVTAALTSTMQAPATLD